MKHAIFACVLLALSATSAVAGITETKITPLNPDGITPSHSTYFGCSMDIYGNTAIIGSNRDLDNNGAAYLFDITTGKQLMKFQANDKQEEQYFGWDVGIYGNTAIIGASNDHEHGQYAGAAYLFNTQTGQQIAKLVPNDIVAGQLFGRSVAIYGNIAAVGNSTYNGAVYLFDATTGQQIRKLTPFMASKPGSFGKSISISNNIAIIGDSGVDQEASLFNITTGRWLGTLKSGESSFGDGFGESVAIDGNIAVVGSPGKEFGDQNYAGAAYIFDITNGKQIAKLTPDSPEEWDRFGGSVAIDGDIIAIGCNGEEDAGPRSGAVYLYNTTGERIGKLTASDGGISLGGAIAISDKNIITSAHKSAYIYNVPEPATMSMLAIGGFALLRRSRKKRNA